jgi:ADP-ribose pyrophosphatase
MSVLEPLTAHTISSRRIYEGSRISLRVDEFRLGNKPPVSKEIIEHPGSVVILPVTDDRKLVLVRQWRQAAGKVLLEAPSGTIEPGEQPEVTARRELREEAGVSADHLAPVGGAWVAPGYSGEYTYGYVATGLRPDPLPQDDGEDIHTIEVPLIEIAQLVREGKLEDQITIAVIYAAVHVFGLVQPA